MKANENPRPRPGHRLMWLFLPVLLLMAGACAWAAWEITGLVRLGGDARALRNSLNTEATPFEKRFEISAGTLTVHLARLALHAAPLPPEARSALRAINAAEVGVYELRRTTSGIARAGWFSAADRAMADRGWERLAGVIERETLVAVYVRPDPGSAAELRVCFAVLNGGQLVIGSARGDLEEVAQLAFDKLGRHPGGL